MTSLGLGADAAPLPPLLSSLFVDLSQRNFVQGLTIKALAQIWKNLHKINDVIIVRKLAKKDSKKSLKRAYFKTAAAIHLLFNRNETLQKDSPFMLFLE